jgi:hypothetical protein
LLVVKSHRQEHVRSLPAVLRAAAAAFDSWKNGAMSRRPAFKFDPALADRLEDPQRDAYLPADRLVGELGLAPAGRLVVADWRRGASDARPAHPTSSSTTPQRPRPRCGAPGSR